MKYLTIAILLLSLLGLATFAQSPARDMRSPKEVVDEFWSLETGGVRLKADGWHRIGNSFFVHSGAPPEKKMIGVVSSKYKCSVDERLVKDNHAEIANECIELGRIDNELHYTHPDPGYDKINVVHYLVLTDKHWEMGADGILEREVHGPLAWRIENPEPLLWLNLDAAVRYVKEVRRETRNATLRQNAERTLARLTKLR